jgi:hypothetical protein
MPAANDPFARIEKPERDKLGRRLIDGQTPEQYLATRFERDNCLDCGGGASAHQVRIDRYGDPIVECINRWGFIEARFVEAAEDERDPQEVVRERLSELHQLRAAITALFLNVEPA